MFLYRLTLFWHQHLLFWEPFRQEAQDFLPSIDPSFCQTSLIMSKEWSNSWNSKNWNWHDQQWNQGQEAWTQPETWQSQEVPPPKIHTPPEWKSTSTMYDDELLYGHKFHKTIQPTAWSRRKNICGLNPLTVPIGLLTRHGASEFGLRLLSEGRFLGIITTRSIAESVFGAQLLKAMRDQGVDIDTLSEHLHRTADPDAPIPSKSEDPTGFMSPLIHAVVSKLKEISPTKQDTQALRELQHVQKKLKETEEKLRQSQKAHRTPSLPEAETPSTHPAVGSQDPEEDPIEPFEEHPPLAPSKKRRTSAAALGASPKAWSRSLGSTFRPGSTAKGTFDGWRSDESFQASYKGSTTQEWVTERPQKVDGTIWCGDPTDSQENLGNVGWPQIFQGKTAECSSPVRWSINPRVSSKW